MKVRLFCCWCCLAICTACTPFAKTAARPKPVPQATPAAGLPDLSAYRLGTGDKVRVDVFGEADLSVEVTVDGTGRIAYPLLGSVQAVRKTARELEETITGGLANGYLVKPDVRVTVIQYRPFYVIGQVQKAGAYPYVIGLTVEKALALAGGLTNLASTRKIYLLHEDAPGDRRTHVGLDAAVLPGDTVVIEEGLF